MKNKPKSSKSGTSVVKSGQNAIKNRPLFRVKDRRYMLRVLETLYILDGLSDEERLARVADACVQMREIAPNDGLERILAAQMLSIHEATMECLRRASLDGQTNEARESNLNQAAKLAGLFARQMEALDKHRGKGQQKVTVEHVHVESGGQAVVGSVHTGGGQRMLKPAPETVEPQPTPGPPRKREPLRSRRVPMNDDKDKA